MKKGKIINIPFMRYYAVATTFGGQPTHFEDKIVNGQKIHTIRKSYDYWASRIDNAQKSPDSIYKLSLWSDKPYVSKQYQAQTGEAHNIWYAPINFKKLNDEILLIDDVEYPLDIVSKNDGLPAEIFRDWFKSFVDDNEPSIIIGWTNRPY
ncbi:hypothetical protein BFP77_08235 [Maribacter sp. 4U21]|uniref:hypothetical protein n=1 Tax=Maribacter sp. 4U21 TaxID=1889779 RepID=UPI000C15E653|nr:hypothetical protein [Maribacter sp. 4U21]PIB28895.1 hypothetical protein BFP77_08235 [Maribacter sp. 4U21]